MTKMLFFVCVLLDFRLATCVKDRTSLKRRLADSGDQGAGGASSSNIPDVSSTARRGGIRQRLASAIEEEAIDIADDELPLTDELKSQWAAGHMSSKVVQKIAFAALKQGARGLGKLASLGDYGNHPQNIHRALVTSFGLPVGAPDVDWVKLPTKFGRETPHPVLMPHKFFAEYYKQFEGSKWISAVASSFGACEGFWRSIRSTPFFMQHPALKESLERTIPCGIHADAGAFSLQDSLYTISWNSLLGAGSTIQQRFLFSVVKKSDMVADTLDVLLRNFSWSLNALALPSELNRSGPVMDGLFC